MWKRIALIPMLMIALRGAATAQESAAVQPDATAAEAPATETAPAAIPAPPPPGPEVMRPTQHGLRLTPDLARAFGAAMASGTPQDQLKLSPEQRKQLTERNAARLMEVVRKHQQELQPALEHLITLIATHADEPGAGGMKVSVEEAQQCGKLFAPLATISREVMDAMEQEASPVLTPEQREQMRKHLQEGREDTQHMEEVLKRWSEGGYREGDNPFHKERSRTADGATTKPAKPEMRNSEAVADAQVAEFGPPEWRRLLDAAKRGFAFDEQQMAKADQLLADYRAKADAIMTAEWKQAARSNRIKWHLRNWLRKQPCRPFVFHLQQEYAQLTKPVNDLGTAFRAELLALVTPEQRAAAAGDVQSTAATVGLAMVPTDEALLGLAATTQPSAGSP